MNTQRTGPASPHAAAEGPAEHGTGGLPPVPWNRPSIGNEEITAVTDTLRSGWLTHGPRAQQFEAAVRDDLGVDDAVATTSCTAALHLALLACGIGDGDEVITPSLTFTAAPNALLQVGAHPVLVDIEPATHTICPHATEAAITPRTRAIIVMHYGGHPCNLTAFRDLADRHGLHLIEDAAHALHAWRDGHRAGTVGDLATFSFYANKVITTGEGGMLVGRADLVQRARLLGRHGIDAAIWQRHGTGRSAAYDVTAPGLKYVMPDILAAIGTEQWAKLPAFTARRAQIAATYTQALAHLEGLTTPTVLPDVVPGWFLYSIFIDPERAPFTRDQLAERLRDRGVSTSQHFRPIHSLRLYAQRAVEHHRHGLPVNPLPITELTTARQLSLPCFPGLLPDEVDRVIAALHDLWNN